MSNLKILMNGIITENPTFVLLLGMCPTLGTTSSAINGMSMGLATMFVLICSNIVISALKNVIPDLVRIPGYIVVIATFVTVVQMCMEAFVPALYASLGLFIPLIVVNCIVLGRAEAFAAKNGVVPSAFDGIGIGLGLRWLLRCWALAVSSWETGKLFQRNLDARGIWFADLRIGSGSVYRLGLSGSNSKQICVKHNKRIIWNIY
mgnify:CR=1 FL=1